MKFSLFALGLSSGASAFVPTAFTALRKIDSSFTSTKSNLRMALQEGEGVVLIGVAADSGCGKSTFMRRLTNTFGGDVVGPLGGGFGTEGGWETNTLVSDLTTVICLDDYHSNDRAGRKVTGRTALDLAENDFDTMYEQLAALKAGKSVEKPIYNHVNGTLDTPETIEPTPIVIVEGLHPMADDRVRSLLDFSLYLDISDEVKLNWKIQRDMKERGHSLESILASIEARKPDFDAFIAPQKRYADLVIEVLPTNLDPEDKNTLRVRCVQKKGVSDFSPCYLFDEGSTVSWTPPVDKIKPKGPGLVLKSSRMDDGYGGEPVQVLEMDGSFQKISELAHVESKLSDTSTKYFGELTQAMLKLADAPGSDNGTGVMQTLAAFAIRELYEKRRVSVDESAAV